MRFLSRLLSPRSAEPEVHFHLDAGGRPAVCEFPRCDRPHLSVG